MPTEMIPFPEFVRRLIDAGAHDLADWQLAVLRDWTSGNPQPLHSMPRHHGRNQIDHYLDYARRAYEIAFEQNAEYVRIAHTGEARMLDDDEPVQPTPYTTIRVREPAPESHRDHTHIQMVHPSPDRQFAETAGILSDAIRRQMLAQIEEQTFQDMTMAAWFGHREPPQQQVPDEITDADRERWANELETTPMPDVGQDAGGGLSSDELLEAIGSAVDEWKDVRDG